VYTFQYFEYIRWFINGTLELEGRMGTCSCCGGSGACFWCETSWACKGIVEASGRACAAGAVDDEACPLASFSGFLKRFTFGMAAYS